MNYDYYEERGCCLTCDKEGAEPPMKGYHELDSGECLCYECKCRRCEHYEPHEWGEGYCTLAVPPTGSVVVTVKQELDSVEVKTKLYFDSETFKKICDVLRLFYFRFDKEKKLWTRYLGNPQSIPAMKKELEKLRVTCVILDGSPIYKT